MAGFLWIVSGVFDAAAQESLGSIVGRIRVVRGDAPTQRVMVFLDLHKTPMDSTYTDSQGTFGFHNLLPESYEVRIEDDQYQSVHVTADIRPISLAPTVMLDIQLTPKSSTNAVAPASRQQGSNPNLMDIREYSRNFPKKAVKEFEKGAQADRDNNKDEAIAHYRKAIELAPDFYPAHNNLGSDELNQSHLEAAHAEFEKVVELNRSDAMGYFNLANVCMLMSQLPDAQNFLNEGFRRQPDSAFGKFLQGTLHLRTGKLTEAVGQLHAFLNAFPSGQFRDQAQRLLQRLERSNSAPPSTKGAADRPN